MTVKQETDFQSLFLASLNIQLKKVQISIQIFKILQSHSLHFESPEVRQEAVQQALAALKNRPKPSLPMPSKRSSVFNRSPDRHKQEDSGQLELFSIEIKIIECGFNHQILLYVLNLNNIFMQQQSIPHIFNFKFFTCSGLASLHNSFVIKSK